MTAADMRELTHVCLDACGFAPPPVGPVCDVANACIYAGEGDAVNATMSLWAAAPGVGDASKLYSSVKRAGQLGKAGRMAAAGPIRIGPKWPARAINDPACRNGCERVASQIQKHTGGEIKRIVPADPSARNLGAYRKHDLGWFHHEVVVKEGRVYDAFTGHEGLPIDEYKSLWQYRDAINFGF
jgi:hypothetical protein